MNTKYVKQRICAFSNNEVWLMQQKFMRLIIIDELGWNDAQ